MSKKLIERRRSQRRSEGRRSTSSNVSKVLDDESDVFDTPSPLWYKNLKNVTPTNKIPRLSYGLEDDTILSQRTTVNASDAPKEWWKHLNTTDTPHLPSTSQDKSQAPRHGDIEVSTDTSESENLQKRKRLLLRPKKRKSRRSTNVFDNLMNESESAIASEPIPVTKNKTKDDISSFQSYDEASLNSYPTEITKKLNQSHEEIPKERRGFGKNRKQKVAVRMFDEVMNSQSLDNIDEDDIEIGSVTKTGESRSSRNHEQSSKLEKSASNPSGSFKSKKEVSVSTLKNKQQESTTSDSDVDVRQIRKERPKFSRKPRKSLGANVFDEIPAEESLQLRKSSMLEEEVERKSSPRKSSQKVNPESSKTRKSLSKVILDNKSSELESNTSESSLNVTSDKSRKMRPNFKKRKSMLQKVHIFDEILAEESRDSKRLKIDSSTSKGQTDNEIPADKNLSKSQSREISSPNLEVVATEFQEASPAQLDKSRRSYPRAEGSVRTLRLQEDLGNTIQVSPKSSSQNKSRGKDARIKRSSVKIQKSNVTSEIIGNSSRILQVDESFSEGDEETEEQQRKVPPGSPKRRKSLRATDNQVILENSRSSEDSKEIPLQGAIQLSLEKSAKDQHLFTSTPLQRNTRITKTLSPSGLQKENSRRSENQSPKSSRILEPISKHRISKYHGTEVSGSGGDRSSPRIGRKKVLEQEKPRPRSFQESFEHFQKTVGNPVLKSPEKEELRKNRRSLVENSEEDDPEPNPDPNSIGLGESPKTFQNKSRSRNKSLEKEELVFRKNRRTLVESPDEEELESDLDPVGVDEGPETVPEKSRSRNKTLEKEELVFRKNRRTLVENSGEEELESDVDPAGVDEGAETVPEKSRSRNQTLEKEELIFRKNRRTLVENSGEEELESDVDPAGVDEGPETVPEKSRSRNQSLEKEELVFRKNRRTLVESPDEEDLESDLDPVGVDEGPETVPEKSRSRNQSLEKEELVFRKNRRTLVESPDEEDLESDLDPVGVDEGPETVPEKSRSRNQSLEKEELIFRKNRRTLVESPDEEELESDLDPVGVDEGPETVPEKSRSRNKSSEKESIVFGKTSAGGRHSRATVPASLPRSVSGANEVPEEEGDTFTNVSVPVQRKSSLQTIAKQPDDVSRLSTSKLGSGKDLSRSRKQLPNQRYGFISEPAQTKISAYFKPMSEADKEKFRQAVEKVDKSMERFFQKMPSEVVRKLETMSSREEAEKRRQEQLKLALKKKGELLKKSDAKKKNPEKPIPAAYIVNGKVYKPRKLPRPARYCTDRLYQFLMKRLEPKYGTMNKVRAEKFVIQLVEVMKIIGRRRKYESYRHELRALKKEMARLGIVHTDNDFFNFAYDFLPQELQDKIVPILLPGNATTIPYFPEKLNAPILKEVEREE